MNSGCQYGLCQPCCVHAHRSLQDLPRCRITAHANAAQLHGQSYVHLHYDLPLIWPLAPFEDANHWHEADGEPEDEDEDEEPVQPSVAASSPSLRVTRSRDPRTPARHPPPPSTPARSGGRRAAAAPSTPVSSQRSRGRVAPPPSPAPARPSTALRSSHPSRVSAGARSTAGSSSFPEAGPASTTRLSVRKSKPSYAISTSPIYDLCLEQADEINRARVQRAQGQSAAVQAKSQTFALQWWNEVRFYPAICLLDVVELR